MQDIESSTMRRVAWRVMPFLMAGYFIAFIDRGNVGFAALQMNQDIGLSASAFGLGAGLFFLSYSLLEVPSNLVMQRVGARLWIARIMITWGMVSGAMAWVVGPYSFNSLRLLLGAAEAGFFPGVVLYITYWFPATYRGRIIAIFMVAIPVSSFLGSPVSALLLMMDGIAGLRGWQWLFIVEAIPAILLGLAALFVLSDRPADARWLSPEQRQWLTQRLEAEHTATGHTVGHLPLRRLLFNRHVLIAALLCSGSAAASQSLVLWQPLILKSFGLSNLETGLVNAIPYGIASIMMVVWGHRSDRRGERVWHTGLPLAAAAVGLAAALLTDTLAPTVLLLCVVLTGTYAFKGPFWSLTTEWLASGSAAAGIAYVNAVGAMAAFAGTWLIGLIKDATGSFPLALTPMAALCAAGVLALALASRRPVAATQAAP